MNIKNEHIGTKLKYLYVNLIKKKSSLLEAILLHKIRKGSEHGHLELNGHNRDNAPA